MESIELFSGAGGLALGAARAKFKHTMFVEKDRHSCDSLTHNIKFFGSSRKRPLVLNQNAEEIDFRKYEGKIELVSGGPPCQPFSIGGKHRANHDERDLFKEAVRALREVKPKAFIFENVKGLTRATFNEYFSYITLQLNYPEVVIKKNEDWTEHWRRLQKKHTAGNYPGLEYNIVKGLFNAANYGVPQTRERIFFVGFRNDLGIEWSFPEETHSKEKLLYEQWVTGEYWDRHKKRAKKELKPSEKALSRLKELSLFDEGKNPWVTVRDTLKGLPHPAHKDASRFANHELRKNAKQYKGHTGSFLDLPSKTLKAGVHGVPGGENMLIEDNGSVRYYTTREAARLQQFPDEYHFISSWTESMRQIGNAVPVGLAEIFIKSIQKNLKNVQ